MAYTPTLLTAYTLARVAPLNAEFAAIAAELAGIPSGEAASQGRTNYLVATGVADAYAVAPTPVPGSYTDGMCFNIKWPAANTGGAATLNVSGLGLRAIKFTDGANPTAGAMAAGGLGTVILLGTTFYLIASTSASLLGVKQTAKTTTTSSAALIVGAFGLGETAAVPTIAGSIDVTTTPVGLWATSAANTGTFPAGAANGLLKVWRFSSTVLYQEWQAANAADRYERYYSGTSWSAWRRMLTIDDLSAGSVGAQPADATLTALAGLATAADRLPYFTGVDAAALATFTSFGRSLVDDADATAGRATLGLGTAATATVQTSATDSTAARLLAVGAFGLGETSSPANVSNIDSTSTPAGLWVTTVATTGAFPSAAGSGLLEVIRFNTTTLLQRWHATGSSDAWERYCLTGAWSSWRRVLRAEEVGTAAAMSAASLLSEGLLGYAAALGIGGAVTQATSKTTSVTLNKITGQITTHAASLAAGASAFFTVNNSLVTGSDLIACNTSGNASHVISGVYTTAGSFGLRITNVSGGTLGDAVVIPFLILKGSPN